MIPLPGMNNVLFVRTSLTDFGHVDSGPWNSGRASRLELKAGKSLCAGELVFKL